MAEYLDDFEDMEDDFEYSGQPCDCYFYKHACFLEVNKPISVSLNSHLELKNCK